MNKIYKTLLISILILSIVVVAQGSAEKITDKNKEYTCVDKVANASPPPDIMVPGITVKIVKEQPLCPEGKVPESLISISDSENKRKELPPVDTQVAAAVPNYNQDETEGQVIHHTPTLICDKFGENCAWFDWAYLHQRVYNTGAIAFLSEHSPFVNPADYHSLAEIAVQNINNNNTVEVGWTKEVGDVTKLFTFWWLNGDPKCYNSCGWQQVSATKYPGMQISTSPPDTNIIGNYYAIQYWGGNWWVWYDDEWIGYYPGYLWSGNFIDSNYIQYFGEVSLSSSLPSDTEMGNGLLSSYPDAAIIAGEQYYNNGWIDSNPIKNATTPSRYSITAYLSNFSNINVSNNWRYGGPRGEFIICCISVSGQLFMDLNGNGIKGPNEPGLSNWTISLTGIIGTGKDTRVIREETTSDTLGFYKFDNLTAGSYILTEKLQEGFVPTSSPVRHLQLAVGENATHIDLSNRPVSNLSPTLPLPPPAQN